LKEANRLGFKQAIIPKSNLKDIAGTETTRSGLELITVASLQEALNKFGIDPRIQGHGLLFSPSVPTEVVSPCNTKPMEIPSDG